MTTATEAPPPYIPSPSEVFPDAWLDDNDPDNDATGTPSVVPELPLEQRWEALANLQRQYIVGSGAEDILCLSLAVAHCAREAHADDMSVWLFLIGNPSTGKSATVKLLQKHPSLVFRDELTAKAFSSGSRDAKGNVASSLLDKLDKKCLVMPDMAAFFEQHDVTVRSILGTMTNAFDGTYDKSSGTAGDMAHVAHFGWLGVTTPSHHAQYEEVLRKLGPRVLAYRPPELSEEEELRVRKITRGGGRRELHTKLAQTAMAHLDALGTSPVSTVPEGIENRLEALDTMFLRGRALICDNGYIQKEGAGRSYQQFRSLMLAVAAVRGHAEVTETDLALIQQIALDSLPRDRAQAIEYLAEHPSDATVAGLSNWLGQSADTAANLFKTLGLLKLVNKQPAGLGLAHRFTAAPIIAEAFGKGSP